MQQEMLNGAEDCLVEEEEEWEEDLKEEILRMSSTISK